MRSAEQPGQALNIDVCFVPEQHAAQEKLPAVSGSSGRLVVARSKKDGEEAHWPGLVFARTGLDYEEAMHGYVDATRDRLVHGWTERKPEPQEPTHWQQEWAGRAERYRVREQRKAEDAAWKAAKTAHQKARQAYLALSHPARQQQREVWQATHQAWRQLHQQRQEMLPQRKREDAAWHQRIQKLNPAARMNRPNVHGSLFWWSRTTVRASAWVYPFSAVDQN